MNREGLLTDCAAPGVFTHLDGFSDQLASIPADVASAARTVQGLLMHEAWAAAYGVALSVERSTEKQLHGAAAMLTRATQLDERPVTEERSPDNRLRVVCRHFAALFVSLLRMRGVPSRARAGFAAYFDPNMRGDHWVGEYWNEDEARWILVDAQLDALQRDALNLDFDPLDVPRDCFLVGGDAWRLCAEGADPMTFGSGGVNFGLLEVYGSLFLDLAALQKIELLPWGWYGLAKDESGLEEVALVNDLASISMRADASSLARLRQLLEGDPRLRVPREIVTEAQRSDRRLLGLAA